MEKYIRTAKINIEKIVEDLYDFNKIGIITIPHVLTGKAIDDLIKSAELNSHLFKCVNRYEGTAEQEMQTLYIDKVKKNQWVSESLQILNQFIMEYEVIFKQIARQAKFYKNDFNKVGFHKYVPGSIGITPHQDYENHINLISIFNLMGNAKFYYCKDRNKTGSQEIDSKPASLVLLRAPRTKNEEPYRPYHYIEPMRDERLSLNIRRKIKNPSSPPYIL